MDAEKLVRKFLLEHDFPTKVNGYHYVKDAIVNALECQVPDCTKALYQDLAKKYNTVSDNIERCIRSFVEKTWQMLAVDGMFTGKPTNREYIWKCAEYISLDLLPRSAYDILDT